MATAKKTTTTKKTAAKKPAAKSTAKKTTAAKKAAAAKTTAGKTTAAKKTTSGSSVKVTATEKKLLELYRAANAQTKKEAMEVLKADTSSCQQRPSQDSYGYVQNKLEEMIFAEQI